jgi:DNA-binding NarL/FixJ family response regulator
MTNARILVVDDHDIVRQGICALLAAQEGWEVCGEARNGREALRMAAELKPDIVIMDLLMPDLNGLDAARQIKKQLPSTEALILSGHEDSELIQSVFDSGIRAYIFKSEARTHLVPAIAALLTRKPYLTARVSEVLFRRFEEQASGAEKVDRADAGLTAREREIVQLLAEGRSNKEVASGLAISTKTVETHRASIMRKLNLDSLGDLVRYAIRKKIIEP